MIGVPDHIRFADAADTLRALLDPRLRARAERPAHRACADFVRAVTASPPPLQHAVPVLALSRAAAALALMFGDPGFIDVVAAAARIALQDGRVTPQDIFATPTPSSTDERAQP